MATATKTTKKPAQPKEAIALLKADHKAVSALFEQYQSTRAQGKKKEIVAKICKELTVHAQVEEEIFYPAFKQALNDKTLEPEARVEQATLKDLISQVKDIEPVGEMFDAKMMVLCEYVKHHVKEEHNEMFPKAKSSPKLDLLALGAQMAARKVELMAAL